MSLFYYIFVVRHVRRLEWICSRLDDLTLPYSVDLIVYEQITEPELQAHIDRVGIDVATKPY